MRPARFCRQPFAPTALAAVAAVGLVALPAVTPTTVEARTPPLAVGACGETLKLEAALGEQFGGFWADAPTQDLRVGILDRAAEPAARAAIEACDAQDLGNGLGWFRAPRTSYVVVQTSYPAVKRAQQALVDWQTSAAGTLGAHTIVSHGIGLGPGDANADGFVGMVVRVTLHTEITDEDVARVEAAVDEIADIHRVTIVIEEHRTGYPVPVPGIGPGLVPAPPTPGIPSPGPATDPPAKTAAPKILGRSTASRRTALSTRRLPVRLRVAAAGSFRVTVRTADRRRTLIARGSATAKRTGQLTVRTTLTGAGRAQLRKARRTAVTVAVQPAGVAKPTTKRIVLR